MSLAELNARMDALQAGMDALSAKLDAVLAKSAEEVSPVKSGTRPSLHVQDAVKLCVELIRESPELLRRKEGLARLASTRAGLGRIRVEANRQPVGAFVAALVRTAGDGRKIPGIHSINEVNHDMGLVEVDALLAQQILEGIDRGLGEEGPEDEVRIGGMAEGESASEAGDFPVQIREGDALAVGHKGEDGGLHAAN
jgi:hypothetical protein